MLISRMRKPSKVSQDERSNSHVGDTVLDTAVLLADIVKRVTDLMPIPFLSASASIVCRILEICVQVKECRERCVSLARRSAGALLRLAACTEGEWDIASEVLRMDIQRLEQSYSATLGAMKTGADAGWVERILHKSTFENAIRVQEQELNDAIHFFSVESLIVLRLNASRKDIADQPLDAAEPDEERRIILNLDPAALDDSWRRLTNSDLVTKANSALERIRENPWTGDGRFIATRVFRNGGIELEANSSELPLWLQEATHREEFEQAFHDGRAHIKVARYEIILSFVSVKYEPGNAEEHRHVEGESRLPPRQLLSTRWLKSPENRTHGQSVADLVANFVTARAANTALKAGIVVCGKRVRGRKMDPEPSRCRKCQRFGSHWAVQCPQEKETCGRCGGMGHLGRVCKETDPQRMWCVNCEEHGHAPWNTDCPSLKREQKLVRTGKPAYKYFPIQGQDWTWEEVAGTEPANNTPST